MAQGIRQDVEENRPLSVSNLQTLNKVLDNLLRSYIHVSLRLYKYVSIEGPTPGREWPPNGSPSSCNSRVSQPIPSGGVSVPTGPQSSTTNHATHATKPLAGSSRDLAWPS
jgi:hypothetical protein